MMPFPQYIKLLSDATARSYCVIYSTTASNIQLEIVLFYQQSFNHTAKL